MKLTNVFIIKQFVSTLVRIAATKLNDHVGTDDHLGNVIKFDEDMDQQLVEFFLELMLLV